MDRFDKKKLGLMIKLKIYTFSENLVHRELRNATFEGEKFQHFRTLLI